MPRFTVPVSMTASSGPVVAPSGTMTVALASETLLGCTGGAELKTTWRSRLIPVPRRVTTSPGRPVAGENVAVNTAASTVNEKPALVAMLPLSSCVWTWICTCPGCRFGTVAWMTVAESFLKPVSTPPMKTC